MNVLNIIKERNISPLLEIRSETVKPVTDEMIDGEFKTTDNLQVEFISIGKGIVNDVTGFLYYYDQSGNKIGHDFDLTNEKFKYGETGMLSFILELPENLSYVIIEITAEEIEHASANTLEQWLRNIYHPREAAWKRPALMILSLVMGIACLIGAYTQHQYHWTNDGVWLVIGLFGFLSALGLFVSLFCRDFWVALLFRG